MIIYLATGGKVIGNLTLLRVGNRVMSVNQVVMNINVATNKVADVPAVKFVPNFNTSVTLPWDYFEVSKMANMVYIDNKFYDIINFDYETMNQKSFRLDLQLEPITTYLNNNTTLNGWFVKSNRLTNTKVKIAPQEDTTYWKRDISFPIITSDPIGGYRKIFYYQITVKTPNAGFKIYAGFFIYSNYGLTQGIEGIFLGNNFGTYPFLQGILQDLSTYLGITADQIADFSISCFCPYRYQYTKQSNTSIKIDLIDLNLNYLEQTQVGNESLGYHVYLPLNRSAPSQDATNIQLSLSRNELLCGKVFIKNSTGEKIYEIPTDWFEYNSTLNAYTLNIYNYYYSDLTGIYLITQVNNQLIISPQGKLPWMGNAFQEYLARSAEYDREALSISIDNVNEQAVMGVIESASNALLTGAISGPAGVAQTGMGFITNEMNRRMEIEDLNRSFKNNENRLRSAISQNYQTTYGFDYMYKSMNAGGPRVSIEMPRGFTDELFENFVRYNGYPCNMYVPLTLNTPGYIQGDVYSIVNAKDNNAVSGVIGNIIRNIFKSGVRIA